MLILRHTSLRFLDDLQKVIFRRADGLQILPHPSLLTWHAALFQKGLEVGPRGVGIVAERCFHRGVHMVSRRYGSCREVCTDSGAEPLASVKADGADDVAGVRDGGIRAGEGNPLSVKGEFQFPPGLADAMASSQVVVSVTLQVRDPLATVPPAALIFTFAVRFSKAHYLRNIICYSVRIGKKTGRCRLAAEWGILESSAPFKPELLAL